MQHPPSRAAALSIGSRRERNLTLDPDDPEFTVDIDRIETPWMSRELYQTLWQNATDHVNSSCVFTKYKPHTGDDRSLEKQLVEALGDDIVVFPDAGRPKDERNGVVVRGYTGLTDNYGLRTVVLIRLEQLHNSEQIAIAVKNTDPIHESRLHAFQNILQHRIQPDLPPPKRPQARLGDTSALFLQEASDEEELSSPPPSRRAAARSQSAPAASVGGRNRSHTLRYRGDRGISFEGYVNKKSDVLPTWKVTYCVLEGDTVAYYESREDFISNSKLIGRIQIQSVEDDNISGKPHGFRIITEGHRVNHLSSRTAFEKEQWKRAITVAISNASGAPRPYVAFGSQPLDAQKFYRLLGALLRQEIDDFPILFRSIHPDVIVTSNFPPIVPFWGQYRRYDGVLLFFSTLLETVRVDAFTTTEVIELVRGDADCIDHVGAEDVMSAPGISPSPTTDSSISYTTSPTANDASDDVWTPSASEWEKRLVVTGKETFNLVNFNSRRITQLFVHELWLDHKDRLVRWHMNGDSVALSVAFDDAPRGENIRLVLPGEASAISHSMPPGTLYVQVLKAQYLSPADANASNGYMTANGAPPSTSKKAYPVYARCILEEGTHLERTLDGLNVHDGEVIPDELSTTNTSHVEKRRPSKGTRLFRGLKRAAGISGERTFANFGDRSGCVTGICKCPHPQSATSKSAGGPNDASCTLNPEWNSNLRLEFPGCARGFTYFLKVEVFQSRFMLPDALLGVCKINLTPHLSLFNGSADAKANGALPRWHNLCDQYNDCKESWAPPTVFRGRIQLGIIFAPTITSAASLNDPKLQGNRNFMNGEAESWRMPNDDTLVQSLTTDSLRELLNSDKLAGGGHVDVPNNSAGRFVAYASARSPVRSSRNDSSDMTTLSNSSSNTKSTDSEATREMQRLARDNHTFNGKKSVFDVPKKYQLIKVVGSGTYGEVIAASDIESGTTVAIKKITNAFVDLPDTKRLLRELCLLRQLKHPNLIRLYDIPRPERLSYLEDIYLVTDLMETDLHRVIHSTQTLTDEHVAHFMRQTLRALAYLHSANILHRDLKPSNILVTSTCDLKICDLGLARYVDYSQAKPRKGPSGTDTFVELTEYVVTRWYRAPEILLDGCRYDKPSDMWSAGCILAELLGRKPLFPGSSTTNQLNKIFNVLGTPDIGYITHVHKEAAQKWLHRQRRRPKIPLTELYPNANLEAIDLLEKLLQYDPNTRLTAVEALRHPYLKEAFRSMMTDGMGNSDDFGYDPTEQEQDRFVGEINDAHERVPLTKSAMQEAVFEQLCYFHPEALEYEHWLKKHDQMFTVDPATGKLVPIEKKSTNEEK